MTELDLSNRAIKVANQVQAIAEAELGDRGPIEVAVRVNIEGIVTATAATSLGGIAGTLVSASKMKSAAEQLEPSGFPDDPQQAIGLADDALVVVSRSQLTGRPKEYRTTIPLRSVTTVHFETGRMGDKLRFELASGVHADFVCVKTDPGQDFADAVNARIRRLSGGDSQRPG